MLETLFIIALFAVVFALRLKGKGFTPPKTAPSDERTYRCYEQADGLFVNRSERLFFRALYEALPQGYHIHGKTRLEDIIRVRASIKGQARWNLRGRVKSRHVDYLITDMNGQLVAAIELDGSSHNKEALAADMLKDGIFKAAALPLIRVSTRSDFNQSAKRIFAQI